MPGSEVSSNSGGPRVPRHATLESRLNSFKEWPRAMTQTGRMMAEAGFFYTGKHGEIYDKLRHANLAHS